MYFSRVRAIHKPSTVPPYPTCPPSILTAGHHEPEELERAPAYPLPRLEKLRWVQQIPGPTTDLLALLSPSLRALHLILRHPHPSALQPDSHELELEARVDALLRAVSAQAPNLAFLRCTRTTRVPEAWLLQDPC